MKKKLVTLLTLCTLGLSIVACNNSNNENPTSEEKIEKEVNKETNTKDVENKSSISERDLPESDYSDTGSGSFSIQTPSGDSADGSIPVLFVSKDDILIQIGYAAEAMDGNHLSYIYVDGMEVSQEQLGERSQGVIDLQEANLKEGVHTVEVVQYSTDEPGDEITTYKSCQYEVKVQ